MNEADAGTITLRPMRWWDIEPAFELEQAVFPSDAWSIGMFWSELAQAASRYYLVAECADGTLAGYAGLMVVGDQADVQSVAVAPHVRRRGVARLLLTALLNEARRRAASSVLLEVRADNDAAQRLYTGLGFETVATRPRYYQPEGVDALVMRLDLAKSAAPDEPGRDK
jgi:ribosomal-protein-alanine N-acetyltransferase